MKRDAELKEVFLGKKTAFNRASLFIFGRLSYVTALAVVLHVFLATIHPVKSMKLEIIIYNKSSKLF